MLKTLVFNGWAAGHEAWDLCTFEHDWLFNYVEQLDGLPEQVIADSDEVLLVGFSMGGSSALRMYLKFPEKAKGLVLVSTTPCMMEERKVEKAGVGVGVGVGGGGGVEWKGMSERRLAALKLATELAFRGDPSPMYTSENMNRGLEYLRTTDLRSELLEASARGGSMPVVILQSERDGIVRPGNAEFLKRVFPQAEVMYVPGAEHVLPVSVPELVDAAVAAVRARL